MPASTLKSPNTLVIFTTAPAGLGHLRVTQALLDGLPEGTHSFILGLQDKTISSIHRVLSNNRFLFNTQLYVQHNPTAEKIFTKIYQDSLRRQSNDVYQQLLTLITSHHPKLSKVFIVATHFGLAHQIGEIKNELIGKTGIDISLHVIVTDDTFQPIWAVKGADRICVPSQKTKNMYHQYMINRYSQLTDIELIPYPISPNLALQQQHLITQKRKQLNKKGQTRIMIPISGAATQLEYLMILIHALTKNEDNSFQPNIVAAANPFTISFANIIKHLPNTRVHLCNTNQETIAKYTQIYQESNPIVLEITKPSEQAYKALFNPRQNGGVILLLTSPIGKQEEDNLAFLQRHQLLPSPEQNKQLWDLVNDKTDKQETILNESMHWRALMLPNKAQEAVKFIYKLKAVGVFNAMLKYQIPNTSELADNGVAQFWKSID